MDVQQAARAIKDSNVQELERILNAKPQLAKQPLECGRYLTHILVDWPGGIPDSEALLSVLIKAGADPNARFKDSGESVLHWAASNSYDHGLIPTLVRAGADPEIQGGAIDAGTPLDNAVHFGKLEAAAALVKAGAAVNNLRKAAGLGRLDLLESYRGELSSKGHSALSAAVFCLQFEAADWLLKQGVDINLIPDGGDSTLLHQVAYRGRTIMAMYLVAKGADLNIPSPVFRGTPFTYGYVHANSDTMNYLIDQGSDISLESAACCGRLDLVMKRWQESDDLESVLQMTQGDQTPVGKNIHPDTLEARAAVARFLRSKL